MTGKFLYGLNVILTLVLSFVATTNFASAEKVRLALPSRSMGYLPMFIALHRGFLKDENIELELPALCDIADVMKLDDSGAALSGALRARVKELRDAHLTEAKIEAAAVSERMTFLMVVPSLIFGLLFLIPPLLRLLSS